MTAVLPSTFIQMSYDIPVAGANAGMAIEVAVAAAPEAKVAEVEEAAAVHALPVSAFSVIVPLVPRGVRNPDGAVIVATSVLACADVL